GLDAGLYASFEFIKSLIVIRSRCRFPRRSAGLNVTGDQQQEAITDTNQSDEDTFINAVNSDFAVIQIIIKAFCTCNTWVKMVK
ncbi:MAG: hypothetical protein OQL09_05955, partial [Gammaproteobacteria bacterium]|nr:hypothetical protein [Gammaproteobacteria bacterium]